MGVMGLAILAALTPACAEELDTSRQVPARGSAGEEIFGVVCDRLGAQALREDLSGGSQVSVLFETPLSDGATALAAEVRGVVMWSHVEGLSHQAGIHFDDAPPALQDLLNAIG